MEMTIKVIQEYQEVNEEICLETRLFKNDSVIYVLSINEQKCFKPAFKTFHRGLAMVCFDRLLEL